MAAIVNDECRLRSAILRNAAYVVIGLLVEISFTLQTQNSFEKINILTMKTNEDYYYQRVLLKDRFIKCVSSFTFISIVHASVCSRLHYCNSLLVSLPKVRLFPLQSVFNAAARLKARLLRFSMYQRSWLDNFTGSLFLSLIA